MNIIDENFVEKSKKEKTKMSKIILIIIAILVIAIIGIIIAIVILATRLYDVIVGILLILAGAFLGNYVQQNKDEVKSKIKKFIDRM